MNQKGLTLVELLVAMVVAGLLGAGVYRTFAGQQHTYQVQDQVVDLQQNARMAINRMTRELRMAGFGKMDSNFFSTAKHGSKVHGQYENVVTPGGDGKSVTVVAALQTTATLTADALAGSIGITISDASGFDLDKRKYISINGMESYRIYGIAGNVITFKAGTTLVYSHFIGEPVYLVMAITYSIGMLDGKSVLLRDDHLGLGPQPVAENIEDLRFRYVMNTGETLDVVPNNRWDDIRMIQATIVATSDPAKPDSELAKVGDGLRRRTLTSNIQLRNLLFL
jgi:prepilin-type N-terminal cleavage/methylation domain-containing protein